MADSKSSKKQSLLTDVAKPGKTAPSASSRPIIVGHKPSIQDPMVNDESTVSEELRVDVKRTVPKVVEPLSSGSEQKQVVTEASEKVGASDTTDTETDRTQLSPETDNKSGKAVAESATNTDSTSTATVDAVIGQAVKDKDKDKQAEKKADELAKREEEVQKLIESKKYFVNIEQSTRKKRKNLWLFLIIFILLLVGTYLAVDSQVVNNNVKLPFEVFKEAQTEKSTPIVTQPSSVKNDADKENSTKNNQKGSFEGEVVESVNKKFNVRIPNGWQMVNLTNSDGLYPADFDSSDSLEYDVSKKPVIKQQPAIGTDAPIRFSINYLEAGQENGFLNEQMTKTVFALDDGTKGVRYYYQEPLKDAEGLGAYPGEKQYIYEFESSDDGKVVVVYRILEKNQYNFANELPKSDPDRLELVEKVIKTLKIN